ncbi:hypothetical protein [uncultured Mucilaginibacter sp.]|uniref:hypothetical protein n=1 Tax=uncultured Mucilaginibacter sp. TaxID=797541 RepID=UPI002635DDAB|nr:hypothetical protein [uncultured Mucilaginibacter sp.]
MKYQLNIQLKNFDLKHAGTKAVTDCVQILNSKGYTNIFLSFNKSPYLIGFSLIKVIAQLLTWIVLIEPNSLVVAQYPIIGINRFFKFFIYILKAKKCKVVCIVHDLNSLRYQESDQQVSKEIAYLNAYDTVISHNNQMTEWLKNKGLTTHVFPIQIFDYLYQEENNYNRSAAFSADKNEIVFAGNLNRGAFINQLFELKELQFSLYGPTNNSRKLAQQINVTWKGTFEPELLITKLQGTFGLIWDGDSIMDCVGEYGNYICYNNPHKISLYFAAGLPVIIPQKAALSTFVERNNLGICINSLADMDKSISQITVEAYDKMLKNIRILQQQLKHGYFFLTALKCIEKEEYLLKGFAQTTIANRG